MSLNLGLSDVCFMVQLNHRFLKIVQSAMSLSSHHIPEYTRSRWQSCNIKLDHLVRVFAKFLQCKVNCFSLSTFFGSQTLNPAHSQGGGGSKENIYIFCLDFFCKDLFLELECGFVVALLPSMDEALGSIPAPWSKKRFISPPPFGYLFNYLFISTGCLCIYFILWIVI
jgi:hypothetical protein